MDPDRRSLASAQSGPTIAQCIAALFVFGALALVLVPIVAALPAAKKAPDQLANGRMIWMAMRNYSTVRDSMDVYPTHAKPATREGLFQNSNEAFEVLVPRFLSDKEPFFHAGSAWCATVKQGKDTKNRILPGENDWCYVRGLKVNSPVDWPILANAFAPESTSYVRDASKPGGVWNGKKAIVVWSGGDAEIVEPKVGGPLLYIQRKNAPGMNAFEKDQEWLQGEAVQVLFPVAPPQLAQ